MSTIELAEAANKALLRFQHSTEDFLKYTTVYAETIETKKALLQTKAELQEKVEIIEKLESAISIFTFRRDTEVNRVEIEIAEVEKQLQLVTEEKRVKEEALRSSGQSLAKTKKESIELQHEVSTLAAKVEAMAVDLQNEIAVRKDAASRLNAATMQLKIYDNYLANLVELNVTKLYASFSYTFVD